MNVYELRHESEAYQAIRPFALADFDRLRRFEGRPLKQSWIPARVDLFREATSFHRQIPGDFPYLTAGVPVFTPKSLTTLADLLELHGEILPLQSKDGDFFAYNVTSVIDCLDVPNSQVARFDDGGIMDVKRYAFVPERLTAIPIFKIPQFPRSDVYVTDEFVKRVKDQGLIGFRFRHLWSSS